jgi:hypothetical protein
MLCQAGQNGLHGLDLVMLICSNLTPISRKTDPGDFLLFERNLYDQKWMPTEEHIDVYAFYNELTERYTKSRARRSAVSERQINDTSAGYRTRGGGIRHFPQAPEPVRTRSCLAIGGGGMLAEM